MDRSVPGAMAMAGSGHRSQLMTATATATGGSSQMRTPSTRRPCRRDAQRHGDVARLQPAAASTAIASRQGRGLGAISSDPASRRGRAGHHCARGIRLVPQKPPSETALLVADFCGFPRSVLLVQNVLLMGRRLP